MVIVCVTSGCDRQTPVDKLSLEFARNVESCVCRQLEYESDSYSGISFPEMVDECNRTVSSANARRYPVESRSIPSLATLRCPEDVEEWQEKLAEVKDQQIVNRQSYSELTGNPEVHSSQQESK